MSEKLIKQTKTENIGIRERLMDAKGKAALAANAVRGVDAASQMPGWTADPETGFLVSSRTIEEMESGSKRDANLLDSITNPEQKAAMERAFIETAELSERIGLTPPSQEDFVAAGVDLPDLATKWQAETAAGRKPEFVIAPAQLTVEQLESLFQNLQDDPEVRKHNNIADGGLVISAIIRDSWDKLNVAPADVPSVADETGREWTIRTIPATAAPTVLGADYEGRNRAGEQVIEPSHPTAIEYAWLQGTLLQRGADSIDQESSTWLDPPKFAFYAGVLSSVAYWSDGAVWASTFRPATRSRMRAFVSRWGQIILRPDNSFFPFPFMIQWLHNDWGINECGDYFHH